VQRSGCAGSTAISQRETWAGVKGEFLEHCYCGTSGSNCSTPDAADGSCRAELEAALETKDPATLLARFGGKDPKYPVAASLNKLLACEKASCRHSCTTETSCGDGVVQERSATFAGATTLTYKGQSVMCEDKYTPSGKGCAIEECDGGPSCDDQCFSLKCGNGLTQKGEECDDGNVAVGDGCDAQCQAEFECGDGKLDSQFGEQCEPPNTGAVCSLEQSMSNASACGCDSLCMRKVCGNGKVQDGEDCDPPNGANCDQNCKRAGLPECVACMIESDPLDRRGSNLLRSFLDGVPNDINPTPEVGCLADQTCYAALVCMLNSKCTTMPVSTACYCGTSSSEVEQCEDPSFVPKGPCASELRAAFKTQFGWEPDNEEVFGNYFNTSYESGKSTSTTRGPKALGFSTILAEAASITRDATTGVAAGAVLNDLTQAGKSPSEIERCAKACE
jgi:cysteine-rich repeat protein